MKVQYLSVMLFCAVLSSFIPGISVEESITVSTDKTSYHYGDNYTISGKVSPVVPNEAVSILILSTNYQYPESLSVIPNSEGRYLHTLPLPIKDISDGNFTIIAQYAGTKNQTAFSYTGLPCYQQNIPAHVYPAPIIRGAASNPRMLDSLGNAITGPVKVGQQIQITYTLANGLNCNQPFVYIVQIQDHNGKTISLSWITGTLLAGQSFDPAQSWTPQYNDTYTAQIFIWQSLVNPNALAPPASISFDVEPNSNLTQSSQLVPRISSNCNEGFIHIIKKEDSSPACVKPEDISKLVERGWAIKPQSLQEQLDFANVCIGPNEACKHRFDSTYVTSENQTTNQAQPTSCDISYNPKMSYQSPLYSNGTILHTDYTTVFYMSMNSTGKMCVHYSNPNFQAPTGIDVFPANDLMKQANITTSANPSVIKTGNSTIVYTIKTGNMAGFYGIRLFCGGMPFAVGYDNQSRIVSSDFPWLGSTFYCPMLSYSYDITSLSGIGIYYITTVSHEQLDYDITNTTVASSHPNTDIQNVTFSVHIRTFAKPANFWFDYKDSTISEFNSNPDFKQTTDPCNWEPAYHNSVGNFPWLGVTQINDNPVTIPPWSNGTYTFSILAKGLPSGYYGFNPVIYGKTTDLPPERAGTNYIAYDYPITIGVGHIMDPSGICGK